MNFETDREYRNEDSRSIAAEADDETLQDVSSEDVSEQGETKPLANESALEDNLVEDDTNDAPDDEKEPETESEPTGKNDKTAGDTPEHLKHFLNTIRKNPVLTREEERELFRRYQEGDEEARKQAGVRLVECNLKLVVSIAKRYQRQGLDFMELIQAGTLGLIKAIERNEPERGNKLSTYATFWIRQSIKQALKEESVGQGIRPVVQENINKIWQAEKELIARKGREPTIDELAAKTELERNKVEEAMIARNSAVRLDQPVGEDGDTTLGELLENKLPSPFETVRSRLNSQNLIQVLEYLPYEERQVLELMHGFEGDPKTTKEISELLGVTIDAVKKHEKNGLRKLSQMKDVREKLAGQDKD